MSWGTCREGGRIRESVFLIAWSAAWFAGGIWLIWRPKRVVRILHEVTGSPRPLFRVLRAIGLLGAGYLLIHSTLELIRLNRK